MLHSFIKKHPLCLAAFFTTTKVGKQSRCPPVMKDKEHGVHLYKGIAFSHEEEGNPAICDEVDGP